MSNTPAPPVAPRVPTRTPMSRPDALARIEERLAKLEERTAWLDEVKDTAPKMVAAAGDAFDAFAERSALHDRLEAALGLLERLTRPDTLQRLHEAVEVAESVPKTAAVLGDTLDGYADMAEQAGVELDNIGPRVGRLSTQIATALQVADKAEPAPKGIFALLRELKDPQVREALGFALAFAKEFGRSTQDNKNKDRR